MPRKTKDRTFYAEQILEVRHEPSGTFLDMRGHIADYIRIEKLLPHWSIDKSVVNFTDEPNNMKSEGAFVGYKSVGYIVLDPPTDNFFPDRAIHFWKKITNNENYILPKLTRFGARTKLFIPSDKNFEEINKLMFDTLYTEKAKSLIGNREIDLRFTVVINESVFTVQVTGGPTKRDECRNYFNFKTDAFESCGIYLDMDYYSTNESILNTDKIPHLIKETVKLVWEKTDKIAQGLGV